MNSSQRADLIKAFEQDELEKLKSLDDTADDYDGSETEEPAEPTIPFPKVTGSLHDLATELCPDLPYEFKFMAAATLVGNAIAGRALLKSALHVSPMFYACLLAKPGRGKDAALKEVNNAIGSTLTGVQILNDANTGTGLFDALYDHGSDAGHTTLLINELKTVFENMRENGNSHNGLKSMLLKLYDGSNIDDITRGNKKDTGKSIKTLKQHKFSICGSCQPDVFPSMWIGLQAGGSGLQDRFTVVVPEVDRRIPLEQQPSADSLPTTIDRIRRQCATSYQKQIVIPDDELFFQKLEWQTWLDEQAGTVSARSDTVVGKWLIVLCVTNDTDTVTGDLLEQAYALTRYHIATQDRYLPKQDAKNDVVEFQNKIIEWFKKQVKAGSKEHTVRDAMRGINASRHPGGLEAFNRAFRACVQAEMLSVTGQFTRKKAAFYKLLR